MQGRVFVTQRRAAAVLCLALLLLTQQVCAGPLVPSGPDRAPDGNRVQVQRRIARMTPLWRIMNSKPFGAYCQNSYECSTGLCRAGHCSFSQRSPSQIANY
ncbi:liver-expressed antimicrobial peptide 2 [Takifugu rubripes]|uniref:Liver-expressed antimicrobial peptide 2-like n=3 Tax=Takifugu TaxID=31032 RepID=A0A3B5K5K1_TAKRU|nr:liver-expressed antimicrobial peptide 2-like [Takifugu rubripes]XP_056884125.1 liver-expressed antimicrobial peptide 2 [Takifugu flavidus]TNM93697.1 hypothetical protein fugu_001873 [Takifugu bimaculatus]TWW63551.1 hypothetical protein D4764_03G0005590 [Takifugu flavidus]|eukprot:XP_011604919.1 PREDICTED: liver-expressed antimicrobial peptide 2-like [Takifugu rubripes]